MASSSGTSKEKAARKSKAASTGADLASVFLALKAILQPYARSFRTSSRPDYFALDDHSIRGHLISFAAVVAKRGRVSFYLLPTIWSPELLRDASSDLMSHRTKAGGFFNFKKVEGALFSELKELVARAHASWDSAAIARS